MKQIIDNIKNQVKDNLVIIACSTGPDSMVLLDLCLKALNKDQIIVAHVNHNVRDESIDEYNFIKEFCKKDNLIFESTTLSLTQNNFEEVARSKRYEFLLNIKDKYNAKYILLGHHANDNLETIIMRLIKSSSLKAYAGILELSNYQNVILYRPFIKIPKTKIIEYANNNNIKYFIDHTNELDDHLRNRIRKYITPLLLKENPNLYEAISYYSETILGANSLLEKEKVKFINNYVKEDDLTIFFEIKYLLQLDKYLQKQILFRILKRFSFSKYQIEEIFKIINSSKNKIISNIDLNCTCIKEYGKLIFTKKTIEPITFELLIDKEGTYKLPNNQELTIDKNNCYFITGTKKICYNNISLPINIRNIKNGDTIKRTNKKTNVSYHQKVNDILTNKKISYIDRLNTLVITNSENQVINILGLIVS